MIYTITYQFTGNADALEGPEIRYTIADSDGNANPVNYLTIGGLEKVIDAYQQVAETRVKQVAIDHPFEDGGEDE